MKAAIIMPLAEQRGGGELMLVHLMQQGRSCGVEWTVIFLQDGPMVAQVAVLGVKACVVPAGRLRQPHRFLSAVGQIAALVRRERISLLIGWMGISQLYGGLAARLTGVPAMWYQLGIPLDKNWMDRLATRLPALGILTCSQAGAAAQGAIPPSRPIRVVYPGVELDRFDLEQLPSPAEARRRLGLPGNGPLIGMVGRLQRWKGMHVLVEAMPEILRHHPDAHAVIVGGEHALEPDYEPYLKERIQSLGLTAQVTLAGLQHNIPEWMQAMDVFVHASDHEPFGIVIIEALALGKPVVAGDAAGPREIITDGADGLLTPYGDAPALAGAVERYLDDPAFARAAGEAAFQRARDFSTERYAQSFVQAIRELCPGAF